LAGRKTLAASLALAAVLVTLASGCAPTVPAGQVVARVDGVEITRRELLFEIESDPAIRALDGVQAQRVALETLVARKLLVAAASRALIDRSPDFIAARRRNVEMQLVGTFSDRLGGETGPAAPKQIDSFIGSNPHMFSRRELLVVLQRSLPRALVAGLVSPVRPAALATIMSRCQAENAGCTNQRVIIDTQSLDGDRARALTLLPEGSALLTLPDMASKGDRAALEVVVHRQSITASAASDKALAMALLREQAAARATAAVLDHLRKQAVISFQPGFAPPST